MEAAFFDLDKTIVARSSPFVFGRSFYRQGLITRPWLLKSLYAQLMFHLMGANERKMERMRAEAAKLTAGWEVAKVRAAVHDVLEEVVSPILYAEALELIHDHRAARRMVCIVSSSPEVIVDPLARILGIDHWIATKPRVANGRYTGELDLYVYGAYKGEAIQQFADKHDIDLGASFAYSDSITDLPMLEAVGNPVAVNPDRELRQVASARGWRIEHFRSPVALRDRLPRLPHPHVTLYAGLAAAAGLLTVAAAAWWLSRRALPRGA